MWQIIETMKQRIVGRKDEIAILDRVTESSRSEFVAIYGRRRVGKTYLVREYYDNKFAFHCSGLSKSNTKAQLQNFNATLQRYSPKPVKKSRNWLEAFDRLIDVLEASSAKRKIVFLDELPWMDTPRSNFIPALEHLWNDWASGRRDVVLVVCGSATSWMMDKLINNKGGLHNRLTNRVLVQPFTLLECEAYFASRKIKLSRYQIAECYMIMGGIPYYLDYIDKAYSLNENIDRLFFRPQGQMRTEFENLYSALFKNSDKYMKVVELLSKKAKGLSREELASVKKGKSGADLTKILSNLEKCGFIRSYTAFGQKTRNKLYQLIDPYTLFYFQFIHSEEYDDQNYWTHSMLSAERNAWAGYSFEMLCLNHQEQIKKALGVSGIMTKVSSWRAKTSDKNKKGTQIDLVIDRKDGYINICEMKFYKKEFAITREYYSKLEDRLDTFIEETKTRKAILLTFITSYGLTTNEYSDIVQKSLTLEDLFV